MFKIFNLCLGVVKSVFSKESKELVGTREEELNKLLKVSIVKKDLRNFEWALEQMDRKPSAEEVIAIAGEYSWKISEEDVLSLLKMTEGKIPQEVLDRIVNAAIGRKGYGEFIMKEIVSMGSSTETCKRLFDDLFEKASLSAVDVFLLHDNSERSKEDFLENCKKTGNINLVKYAKNEVFNDGTGESEVEETLKYALKSKELEQIKTIVTLLAFAVLTHCFIAGRSKKQ